MKQNGKMLILVILSMISGIGLSYALNITQTINNTVAYIQKMVFTIDGTDNTAEKLVIDGSYGSITMSGALNIQSGALKDDTVSSGDLMDAAVTTRSIANGSVTNAQIANNAVDINKLSADLKTRVNNTAVYSKDIIGSGDLDMTGNGITNLRDPVLSNDAATKSYVDAAGSTNDKNYTSSSSFTNLLVFATQGVYDGNLGGMTGADAICNNEAHQANYKG